MGETPLRAVRFGRVPLFLTATLLLGACSTARIVSAEDVSTGVKTRPPAVHVVDFDLPGDAVKSQSLRAVLPLHTRLEQAKAQSLVDKLSRSIVDNLQKKGIAADRVTGNQPLPPGGWLVRGVFTTVDEGNRLARAAIGFGVGATDVEVSASIERLSPADAPTPLYRLQTDARSGKMPGAAVTLNPYVAAAKFVLDGRDLDRSVSETAQKIADEISRQVRAAAH
ncbi:protein of unknown function [Enhydrobacter aerosaccus]|uniref:DUF4410 domain-containing protein n=1 Tax=Enhydrobacter aerosaccus TaxID=225324 RepID=A0A1T4RJS1_9HYPH|nr:DUF4410 domain-containing protein [Enhydrobacter aerosaccus]SKA16026.1 protein of unknown function [Enhydrobacter aerosaccus]